MARQEFKVQANNFTGGLITEASPLSFPENSCLDIQNMDINIDGSVGRRHALRPEPGTSGTLSTINFFTYNSKSPTYVWRQAGGIPGNNLVCVQDGNAVRFYREDDTLGDPLTTAPAFINLVSYRTEEIIPQPPVSMTNVRGVLVITGRNITPIAVEYEEGTPPSIIVNPIDFNIRDLDGVDDGLRVDERPLELSDTHFYNLINQGWDVEKIDAFEASQGRYPSNADIWAVGKDANNDFSPNELVKVDFGTSPAPKGRLRLNLFDTRVAADYPLDAPIVIDNITSISILGSTRSIEIDTDNVPHELLEDDLVLILGVEAWCPDYGFVQLDGVHTVASVQDAFRFRINVPIEAWCTDMFVIVTSYGVIHRDFLGSEEGYVTAARPTVVATYAGRAFYAGVPFERLSNQIFFSQILTDTKKRLGQCMQEADPTSEIDPDIVAKDGGVITINDLGEVLAMKEQQQSLVVFTSNGVWEITGEGDSFFTALGYTVRKITSVPVVSGCAVVDVEGTLMFMGEDGIYLLQPNEISGLLTAINITAGNIKSYYLEDVMPCGGFTCGVYDYKRRQVLWLHGTPPYKWPEVLPGGEDPAKGRLMTNALVFNLDTQSFTKYKFSFKYPEILAPDNTTPRIVGAVQLRNISANSPAIRFFTRFPYESVSRVAWYQLDTPKEDGFVDVTFNDDGLEVPSFVITGHATLDDVGVRKTARQLILHMLRTETGFTPAGDGGSDPIHPSSAKVRIAWDFTNDEASNKWMPEFQGYRYRQLFMPATPGSNFNTGYQVITTKTKLRGTGRAFSMQFRSEPEHDMNILGWSITGSAEANE